MIHSAFIIDPTNRTSRRNSRGFSPTRAPGLVDRKLSSSGPRRDRESAGARLPPPPIPRSCDLCRTTASGRRPRCRRRMTEEGVDGEICFPRGPFFLRATKYSYRKVAGKRAGDFVEQTQNSCSTLKNNIQNM